MTEQLIRQRIKYLVEYGGVLHDPVTELAQRVRWLGWTVAALVVLSCAELTMICCR